MANSDNDIDMVINESTALNNAVNVVINESTGLNNAINVEITERTTLSEEDLVLYSIISKLIMMRKRNHLSQAQMAEKCNLHRNSICRFESYEDAPSIRTLIKYANALGMKIELCDK